MLAIAESRLKLIEMCYALVEQSDVFNDKADDIKERLAVSMVISAERAFSPGMTLAEPERSPRDRFVDIVSPHIGKENGELVAVVLDAITKLVPDMEASAVKLLLIAFGIKSPAILEADLDGLVRIFTICQKYAEMRRAGFDDRDAKLRLASEFGLSLEQDEF